MKYIIRRSGRSIEISEATSSLLVYRIPYQNLNDSGEDVFKIKNKFIVYILFGENNDGPDVLYVGKSTNGLKNRPTSHGDKYDNWTYCYILTQFEERTFFNDGTIQYIEDRVNKQVNDLKHYRNTTVVTNKGTANRFDMEDCDKYLEKAYEMLDVLGLDLLTFCEDSDEGLDVQAEIVSEKDIVPDGIYYMSRKLRRWGNKVANARLQVTGGKYILLSGSDVCPNEGPGLMDVVRIKRENANIINDVLQDDIVFNSTSGAASFVIGGAANGWCTWKDENGDIIDIYRL